MSKKKYQKNLFPAQEYVCIFHVFDMNGNGNVVLIFLIFDRKYHVYMYTLTYIPSALIKKLYDFSLFSRQLLFR